MIQRDHRRASRLGSSFGFLLLALVVSLLAPGRALAQPVPPTCPPQLGTANLIDHDFTVSFCELCDTGTVRIVVDNPMRNPTPVDFSAIVVTEDLRASGLTYVGGTTTFQGVNIAPPPVVEPVVSGPNGSVLTWTLSSGFSMPHAPGGPGNEPRLIIEFDVVRQSSFTDEGLVLANRTIETSVALTPSCAPAARYSQSSGPGTLPLREPRPNIRKRGRNVDAGQASNRYSDTVYAHEDDDVIWRVRIRNPGQAPLQDFEFSDSIVPGNFTIHHVCDTEGAATSSANGGSPGRCVAVAGPTDVLDFDVAQAFGNGANPYIVAPAGGQRYYYLVGRVTDSCTNRTNTVYDVEWGCQSEPPPGGISATSTGQTAGDTANLRTRSVESGLQIDVALTGVNTAQPMGARGTVTITIRNRTGGTITGGIDGIELREILPAEYVVDTTFTPTFQMSPAYGNSYPGMIDTFAWTNAAAGTVPLTTNNPALPLSNGDLQFVLTSSTTHPDPPNRLNMIRHGDDVTITFRTVQIDPQYYDKVGNLDVRIEAPNSDPLGTDPTASFPITNRVEIWFDEYCTGTEHHLTIDDNDTARPEDLDIDLVGTELLFILTNSGDPLPLTMALTNNGGHDATDYQAYVTFGQAMVVQTVAPGCVATTNPPPPLAWRTPAVIPPTASVYLCDRGTISPGEWELFNFEVVKNTAASFDDDLTFRADVIGEIALSNATPLWFPPPTARTDGITDPANNYSLDAVRARVVGYNLTKDQLGVCTENNPPPGSPDIEVQIGEECRYHIESGGWFGFQTPGFTYIAVQNIQVVDQNPDGQGYITSVDPPIPSTSAIQGVTLNPPPAALADAFFDWTFNTVVPAQRISQQDHWFRVDVTTRLLNDPVDTSAPPNRHADISTNTLTSTFEAVFHNPLTNLEEIYNLGPTTLGFPREVYRRVDLTVTEPQLTLVKEVCNETRYGIGPACSNFVPLADDGDAFDTYVYRITVTNEPNSGGVARAPAYDVTVTSVTDASDLLYVDLLTGDGLDNDGDGTPDPGDANGEGLITDNVVQNAVPAQIVAAYTHSDDLLRIDPGQSVVLYYRVDPDDDVAPQQQLINTVTATYDSLEGAFGSQTNPQRPNGDIGGGRQYVSAPAQATVQIIPVEVSPKRVVRAANSTLVPSSQPQPVSIGEEVEFELQALIPVAQLRSFVIRDVLPAGITCSEAPVVNLAAPPYDAAGFVPGGIFTPTCSPTGTEVVWDFGDQTITQSPRDDRRFDFAVQFIARVGNTLANQDGLSIQNGGAATVTTVSYINEAAVPVVLPIDAATLLVSEPLIALTKAFSVPNVDASDSPLVTVTATNNGSATAYNLRVLEDLSAVDLTFAGGIGGTNPPIVDLVTYGPDRPLFTWAPSLPIAPGETISFSFAVQVGAQPEPHRILLNTIQADWTSLPGPTTALNSGGTIDPDGSPTGMRIGALPNAGDTLNDYEAQAVASVVVDPVTVAKLDIDPGLIPQIGAHKPFQVVVSLPEGSTQNVAVADSLDSGTVSYVLADNAAFDVTYEFEGILSINGQPPSGAAFTSVPVDGASGSVVWSIGNIVTAAEDDLATQLIDPQIRINYFARVNNDLVTNAGSTLQNSVTTTYRNGETGLPATVMDATAPIVAVEPVLTATKILTNVTPGKAAGDPPAFSDTLQYMVRVVNSGTAMAHDVNVVDTLPPALALSAGFTPTATINMVPVVGFQATPNGAPDGPLLWGAGNSDGSLDIPAGGFLELTYQVLVRTPLPDPTVLANRVWVDWTSLDSASPYERTGAGCPTTTAPDDYCFGPAVATGTSVPVGDPDPLLKQNTQLTAGIGETFSYRITIPATQYAFPIYDVRIRDDLATSAANMRFVSVTKIAGSGPWTPVNTGTATNLVIEDTTVGIDLLANEQIILEVTVVLEDTPTNLTGLPFTNTASYIYNWLDGNNASQRPGLPGTTAPMTIVEPDTLTLQKSGPAQMTIGMPATFTLDVHNAATGTAWDLTLTDLLPESPAGGTCDTAPTAATARVYLADGVTPVSPQLVQGTDFSVSFLGAPTCELTITLFSAAASLGPDQRLIVSYDTELDPDSQDAISLTNVAGATSWYSAQGPDRRQYTRTLTNGTIGVLDHQDALTTTSALPLYLFEKTVINLTSGLDPGTIAQPGDLLRYRLRVENTGPVAIASFSLVDELDRLNAIAAFQPGTLQLVTVPPGSDTSATSSTGGANGTGLLDVRNLSLPNQNDSLMVEFEVRLAPVLAAGSYAINQSGLLVNGIPLADSDDPNVNGAADPMVSGDEDPTQVLIDSAPLFQVQKVSAYMTGDPNVLLAGETLRYTITVKNTGTDDAVDAMLRDPIPVNVQYVAGSTTLNGAPVADGPSGLSPLSTGILINATEDPTPGAMRADSSATPDNVATISFDVIVDTNVSDGTVISNQALVSAITGGVVDQPSDDPRTPLPDDPTRDVVGNLPLLFAAKDVAIQIDGGTVGVVDPGDTLRYTITIRNSGAIPATAVSLSDAVPANTSYVADSLMHNGLPVGPPGAVVSPLIGGIPVSSTDLTPPLPAPGMGVISAGGTASIQFDLLVDNGVPAGTIISNQAAISSAELPNLQTDGDGNPATGPEPTIVVVGDAQRLSITKSVSVVGGGAALPGSELEYVVRVVNVATVPATDVTIIDDLDVPVAGQLTYVNLSATMNGAAGGISVVGSQIMADYSTSNGPLQPGQSVVLRFRAVIDPGLAIGTTVTNTGTVSWDTPPQTASASVSVDVGGMPGVGVLSGTLWHDADFNGAIGAGERALQGWSADLYRNGQLAHTTLTDASGAYQIGGLEPNDTNGDQYRILFRAPGAAASTGSLGLAASAYTNGPQEITDIVVPSGSNLQNLDLPIQPNGVVYDSVQRAPIAGVTLRLLNSGSGMALPSACFDDAAQQGQTTLGDGYYKFDLNFSDPACPSGGSYIVDVSGGGAGYGNGLSQIIPPISDGSTTPLSVPACPGSADDAIPATAQHCEAQPSAFAPAASVPARSVGTNFHAHLVLDNSQTPGSSQIFNNHIAMDPVLDTAVAISKTTPSVNVILGQLVPYEITVRNQLGVDLFDLGVVDRFPAGFRYVEGSARLDGIPREPALQGRELRWTDIDIGPSDSRTFLLLLAVGAGVSEGEFVNRAHVVSSVGDVALSGEATATVRVTADPDFACTDVMGRVFDDANRDGSQDTGELGLQGVRLVTAGGLIATTDQHGRFHITCAVTPREGRGSNFVLKLDDRSLPSGYRMSTRQVQVKRATRGKALRFNYGASIHRVVGLDLADAVFEPGSTEIRPQWMERIDPLLEELEKSPATLRLSYVADVEEARLVDRRLAAVRKKISQAWKERDGYPLTIEPEIFWRRGGSPKGPMTRLPDIGGWDALTSPVLDDGRIDQARPGEATERHLPADQPFAEWTQDPELLAGQAGDRLEEREVLTEEAETVKLKNVVPPIRFEPGVSEIAPSYIQRLRGVLAGMQHLDNVRLHLVGHADDQPLSGALASTYGDNAGLSRERAGEVAEFVQSALSLPPEAISFSWAGDTQPLASNATPEGRALNRRVEVEVWYDEFEERVAVEDVVISEEIKRVKVCRVETVCKMRFQQGHERRARIKNLVPPLQIRDENARVSKEFSLQVGQALHNLRDKQNVTVKFVGFTDDVPLKGRAERIYGTHLALSKASARRVELAVQEALDLSTSAVASDGRGAARPLASNETSRGRALNRRIEVEFWYDDPLQELPDEPQLCPEAGGESLLTKVYDPPWGRIPALQIEAGAPSIPAGYADTLRRAMADVDDKANVRLRFVGYTSNQRLDRRTALVYGDDIGLSAARARRTMEIIQSQLGISGSEAEHEGRGYLHSNDVVNAGFIQGETSHVVVQVVYDEAALLDDYEGIDVTRITRELRAKDPLALNLMRITVDGEPIDDPGRSSADIQRCTDVALERADIQFRFDDLDAKPRLSVTSDARSVAILPGAAGEAQARDVGFRMYTNYAHFIERAEVRLFEREQSLQAEPLAVLEIGQDGIARWQPESTWIAGPVRPLKFVLRAYDADGRFDETWPQSLWMVNGSPVDSDPLEADPQADPAESAAPSDSDHEADELLAGYGESELSVRNIQLGSTGSVRVQGSGVPPGHSVWLAGSAVPVDEQGRFVAEAVLPSGMNTVEVAVLDQEGNGELFLRDLEFEKSDWFYVGIADLTLAGSKTSGPAEALQGQNAPSDPDSFADGRLAFYLDGKFGNDWRLTASADTREGPVQDLFTNFLDKSPDALFRRLDPDYYYPTFGDDSTVDEMAATSGKFFVKLKQKDNHALWGNFKVGYTDNELALVERGLYGANLHYQTDATTSFGERRLVLDGFAADPGTVPSREEFRGTGGSLYYLRHRDILMGSDRLRVEIRDKDSGLVMASMPLDPDLDYDIDYFQGRVLLSKPVASTVDDELLVRTGGLSGNEAWLIVQYEFAPGFDEIDSLAAGGEGHVWINDYLKLGVTAYRNSESSADSGLYAANLVARKSAASWLKLQAGWSQGQVSSSLRSDDGGFDFFGSPAPALSDVEAGAYRADISLGFGDLLAGARGRMSLYFQRLDAGYSAPGLAARTDTDQYGGTLDVPIIDALSLSAKADRLVETRGLETTAIEVDVDYQLTDEWSLSAGVRNDEREDDSPVVPLTQEEGGRTDAVLQSAYDSGGDWRGYGFAQATLRRTGSREDNKRIGVGGSYRINDRLVVDGEVSYGDDGPAVQIGSDFQESDETSRYLNYSLDNERGLDGQHARRGNLTSGARTRLSDSSSVYKEDRYQHSDTSNGLSRAMGMDWSLTERWTLGADWETGTLTDRQTKAQTKRNAGGGRFSYQFDSLYLSSGIEYRSDETEQLDGTWSDRTTWLFRNNARLQISPSWRLLAKFNHSFSDSSLGEFHDGGYTEAVLGYAYRPVNHDRLNLLTKYTYFYNVPGTDQLNPSGTSAQFLQRSHIASLDVSYDLTKSWTLGGKYAYRLGQISLDRVNPDYFDNSAHLFILRADWRFLKNWEGSLEGRSLYMPSLDEQRSGALFTVYRYFGKHFKVGVGYNFTDFSEDLTDLSYDRHGLFFNIVGTL